MRSLTFFFFKAEDGIRDGRVTGVQTCALPILRRFPAGSRRVADLTLCDLAAAAAAVAHRRLPAGNRRIQNVRYDPGPYGRRTGEPHDHREHLRVQDGLSGRAPGQSKRRGGPPAIFAVDPNEPGDPPHSQAYAMTGARWNLLHTGGAWALAAVCGVMFSFPVLNTVLTSLKTAADISSAPLKWVFTPTFEHYANY